MAWTSGKRQARGMLSVLACLVPLLVAGSARAATDAPQRPNILLIYTDDQSYRTVSCYPEAYPWARTPNIDRLADEGVRFGPVYIGTWCLPSRASLLTGLHPTGIQTLRSAGRYPGGTYDPAQCPFWPSVFRRHGYVTAQIGKWHTGNDTGYGRDWDFQVVWNRPGIPENAMHYFTDQTIVINGGEPIQVAEYSTDHYTRWALEFIRGEHREAGKPWYLWLCYDAPHGPFTPAERHRNDYAGATVPLPADIYPPRPGKPAYMQARETWVPDAEGKPIMHPLHYERDAILRSHVARDGDPLPSAWIDWVRRYHQSVCALDEAVGKLLEALEETGQRDNTLVVFTSDQGLAVGQHGFLDKHAPYDANIAAPLIVSMPGVLPQGQVCNRPIGGVDLVPTFFRFAGIDLPWEMHGRDLTPLLHNPQRDWPHPTLLIYTVGRFGDDTIHSPPPAKRPDRVPWYLLFRQGRYKYIRTLVANEVEELYDMVEDPEELHNLALRAEHRDRLREYRQATLAELHRIGAGMADHLPPVREAGQ